MLQLKNIKKTYQMIENNLEALKGIDINFRKSEFVSILGPSGCGKTTLLNIVGGLDRYTSGDLLIDGVSTKEYQDKDWDFYRNNTIGFVFQSYNLIMHQSVLKNVELALTLSGVSKEARRNRAIEVLEKVGLKEHIFKKPNQLSGGQMQRVAIARALVNNPSIILADEPTGALDSETSRQIMEVMEDISRDRLVIMVTHNNDIAQRYSTRIINLLDGLVTGDSNPYTDDQIKADAKVYKKQEKKSKDKNDKSHKTAMSFKTALGLSFDNLRTKKARTFLTSFAGSIGIIGIALVLAISTGFQGYIDNMQEETLTSYPLTIESDTYDMNQLMDLGNIQIKEGSDEQFVINPIISGMQSTTIHNNITQDYIEEVITPLKENENVNDVLIDYDINMSLYHKIVGETNTYMPAVSKAMGSSLWTQMLNNQELLLESYELIGDSVLPQAYNEIAVVVDYKNRIADLTLLALGLPYNNVENISIDSLFDLDLKMFNNDLIYERIGDRFVPKAMSDEIYEDGDSLRVTAVLRAKTELDVASLMNGVMYHSSLADKVIASASESDIVEWQIANPTKNAFTNELFQDKADSTGIVTAEQQKDEILNQLNYINNPSKIRIFAVDFAGKTEVIKILDEYNKDKDEADKIIYTDSMALVVDTMNTIVDVISYVLIAFISISLVVSSIMIGIITYISVLERTKEIGILRSIGARKKDISRVFNAETIIVGFASGVLGILVTLLISIPINIIVSSLTGIANIASLSLVSALVLVLISVFLTFIAGLIPAKIATKKDPVEALRQ